MAYRVAYNLSQSPLIVSEDGRVLAVGGYGAVSMTDDKVQALRELDPSPLRLLTPTELEGELPAEVRAAADEVTARTKADADAAAAKKKAEAEAAKAPANTSGS
jgi:hypothetical protein